MRYYNLPPSPFGMRAKMVAWFKNDELEEELPPGGLKSDDFLRINPLGQVPCLIDGDLVLPQSAVIADYLDRRLGGDPLWPAEAGMRARADLMVRLVDLYVGPQMLALIRYGLKEAGEKDGAERTLIEGLAILAHFKEPGDLWLVGATFSHADAALMPFLGVAEYFDTQLTTMRLIDAFPEVYGYWQRARASAIGEQMRTALFSAYDEAFRKKR